MRIPQKNRSSASSASANPFSVLDSGMCEELQGGATLASTRTASPASGPIPVPPPRSIPSVFSSVPVSEAIPITGWGDPVPLPMQYVEPAPTCVQPPEVVDFYPSAASFPSLVNDCYDKLPASTRELVSFDMFQYYCSLGFWLRLSYLEVSNRPSPLNDQYTSLLAHSSSVPLLLPPPVAQYLANIGNFSLDGTLFRARAPNIHFDYSYHPTVFPGYPILSDFDEGEKLNALELLARLPVPCDYTRPLFQSPAVVNLPQSSVFHLGLDAPPVPGYSLGTRTPVSVIPPPLVCDLLIQLGWSDHLHQKLGPFSWHSPTISWLTELLSGEPHTCLLTTVNGGTIQSSFSEYTNPIVDDNPGLIHDVTLDMRISSISNLSPSDYHLACAFSFNPVIRPGCLWTYPSERQKCVAMARWLVTPKRRKFFLDPNLVHPDRLSSVVKRSTYLTWH
jgi:hypothetical protein